MKPNEAHIAHLILAFQDRSISSAEKLELDELILAYPEYAHDLEPIKLQPPTSENCAVSHLLRPEYENLQIYNEEEGHPYDKLAIGSLEGLLNTDELLLEATLQQDALYIKNKQKYVQTILNPDQSIVYPHLNNLIKDPPVRRLTFKKMAVTMSSAAAILLAVFVMNRNPSEITTQNSVKPNATKANQTPVKLATPTQVTQPKSKLLHQALIHPHQTIEPEKRDCIVAFPEPKEPVLQYAQNATVNQVNQQQNYSNPSSGQDAAIALNSNPAPSSALTKEPITVKSFIIQKTNERLFGTPAPSTDLRYETMARYASQTIGLPVRYEVESGAATDKIIFQLGPISIERNRSKK